jgi:hypothetical protein
MAYYGGGTEVTRSKDSPDLIKLATDSEISAELINEQGLSAAIPWRTYSLNESSQFVLTEFQYVNLVKGDTLKSISFEGNTPSILSTDFVNVEAAEYVQGGITNSLPSVSIGDLSWQVQSRLDLFMSALIPQVLTTHTTTQADGEKLLAVPYLHLLRKVGDDEEIQQVYTPLMGESGSMELVVASSEPLIGSLTRMPVPENTSFKLCQHETLVAGGTPVARNTAPDGLSEIRFANNAEQLKGIIEDTSLYEAVTGLLISIQEEGEDRYVQIEGPGKCNSPALAIPTKTVVEGNSLPIRSVAADAFNNYPLTAVSIEAVADTTEDDEDDINSLVESIKSRVTFNSASGLCIWVDHTKTLYTRDKEDGIDFDAEANLELTKKSYTYVDPNTDVSQTCNYVFTTTETGENPYCYIEYTEPGLVTPESLVSAESSPSLRFDTIETLVLEGPIEDGFVLRNLFEGARESYGKLTNLKTLIVSNTTPGILKELPRAFVGPTSCPNLSTCIFPTSVTTIGSEAFKDCEKLVYLSLAKTVTSVGSDAFVGCKALVHKSSQVADYKVSYVGEWAVDYEPDIQISSLASTTTLIADSAFKNCTGLSKLYLPEGLKYIGKEAFAGNNNLLSVQLPKSLVSIGESAFEVCQRLQKVELVESGSMDTLTIGTTAFKGCAQLTTVNIPAYIPVESCHLGLAVFSGCDRLQQLCLPMYQFAESAPAEISGPCFSYPVDSLLHTAIWYDLQREKLSNPTTLCRFKGLQGGLTKKDVQIKIDSEDLKDVKYLLFKVRVGKNQLGQQHMKFYVQAPDDIIYGTEEGGFRVPVQEDNEWHTILIDLPSCGKWDDGTLEALYIRPFGDAQTQYWNITESKYVDIQEITGYATIQDALAALTDSQCELVTYDSASRIITSSACNNLENLQNLESLQLYTPDYIDVSHTYTVPSLAGCSSLRKITFGPQLKTNFDVSSNTALDEITCLTSVPLDLDDGGEGPSFSTNPIVLNLTKTPTKTPTGSKENVTINIVDSSAASESAALIPTVFSKLHALVPKETMGLIGIYNYYSPLASSTAQIRDELPDTPDYGAVCIRLRTPTGTYVAPQIFNYFGKEPSSSTGTYTWWDPADTNANEPVWRDGPGLGRSMLWQSNVYYVLRKGLNILALPESCDIEFYSGPSRTSDVVYFTDLNLIKNPMAGSSSAANQAKILNPRLALNSNFEQVCKTIRDLDLKHEFFYNVPITPLAELDLSPTDTTDTLKVARNWFDKQNVCNPFVISEIDTDYLTTHVQVSKFSKRG